MGTAKEVFRWESINPHEEVGVFIHNYGKDEFVSFSITVDKHSNQPSGAYTQIAAQLTEGLTYDFQGGVARDLWVQERDYRTAGFCQCWPDALSATGVREG